LNDSSDRRIGSEASDHLQVDTRSVGRLRHVQQLVLKTRTSCGEKAVSVRNSHDESR